MNNLPRPTPGDDDPPSTLSIFGLFVLVVVILICASPMSCTAVTVRSHDTMVRIESNFDGELKVSPDGAVAINGKVDNATSTTAQGKAMEAKWGSFGAMMIGIAAYLK